MMNPFRVRIIVLIVFRCVLLLFVQNIKVDNLDI